MRGTGLEPLILNDNWVTTLKDFKDFCYVEKNLSPKVAHGHILKISRFLKFSGNNTSKQSIREFLKKILP